MDTTMIGITIVAGVAGGLGGYGWYKLVGCRGSCLLTSSPWRSTLYGIFLAIMLVLTYFKKM